MARSRRITHVRLLVFLVAVAPLLWPLPAGDSSGPARIISSALLFLVFFAVVAHHQKVRRSCDWYRALSSINEEGLKRLARDWDALSGFEAAASDGGSPFAADLDLFGPASLFSLLGTVGTPGGRARLERWLLEPAGPETVRGRQAAVAELAPLVDLREELTVRGRMMTAVSSEGIRGFLAWAEGEPWLAKRSWLLWSAHLLPPIALILIALSIAGVLDYTAWAMALTLNLAISWLVRGEVHAIFDRAFGRESTFGQYAAIFRLIAKSSFEAESLRRFQTVISSEGVSADHELRKLHRLVSLAEVRLSMMYAPLQALTLWDVHVLHRLEAWQRTAGRAARRWLGAAHEFDALAALAALRYDHPDWVFPQISADGDPLLDARGLGHPLIPDGVCVVNDVQVGPPHTFLMITGSNMSGKSTLLRAIGTNVVLGQAGGPVCATYMKLPPLTVATSMRIHDSLQQGLSHFMAELQRLKRVIDLARRAGQDGRTLLYLLDDILQGTNTAERQVAARRVIQGLLAADVIGAVTTHDLSLAETAALTRAARPYHFSERIERHPSGPIITFDYKLRPGIATSSNALKLVELVGLGPGDEDGNLAPNGADSPT